MPAVDRGEELLDSDLISHCNTRGKVKTVPNAPSRLPKLKKGKKVAAAAPNSSSSSSLEERREIGEAIPQTPPPPPAPETEGERLLKVLDKVARAELSRHRS